MIIIGLYWLFIATYCIDHQTCLDHSIVFLCRPLHLMGRIGSPSHCGFQIPHPWRKISLSQTHTQSKFFSLSPPNQPDLWVFLFSSSCLVFFNIQPLSLAWIVSLICLKWLMPVCFPVKRFVTNRFFKVHYNLNWCLVIWLLGSIKLPAISSEH